MKKTVILLLISMVFFTSGCKNFTKDENTPNKPAVENAENEEYHRKIYLRHSHDSIFNLQTFKYIPEENKYSIEVYLDFNPGEYEENSPFPGEEHFSVIYMILDVDIVKTDNDTKIDLKYKGIITGLFDMVGGKMYSYDLRKHYGAEMIPEVKESYDYIVGCQKGDCYDFDLIPTITGEIYNAYKEGRLYEMPNAKVIIY